MVFLLFPSCRTDRNLEPKRRQAKNIYCFKYKSIVWPVFFPPIWQFCFVFLWPWEVFFRVQTKKNQNLEERNVGNRFCKLKFCKSILQITDLQFAECSCRSRSSFACLCWFLWPWMWWRRRPSATATSWPSRWLPGSLGSPQSSVCATAPPPAQRSRLRRASSSPAPPPPLFPAPVSTTLVGWSSLPRWSGHRTTYSRP